MRSFKKYKKIVEVQENLAGKIKLVIKVSTIKIIRKEVEITRNLFLPEILPMI